MPKRKKNDDYWGTVDCTLMKRKSQKERKKDIERSMFFFRLRCEADAEAKMEAEMKASRAKMIAYRESPPLYLGHRLGRIRLPREILCKIMEHVCDGYTPEGLTIMSLVLQELHNIARSCADFLYTLPYCYRYLSSKVGNVPGSEKREWDEFIVDILKKSRSELLEAMADLGLSTDNRGKDEIGRYPRQFQIMLMDRLQDLYSQMLWIRRAKKSSIKNLISHLSRKSRETRHVARCVDESAKGRFDSC